MDKQLIVVRGQVTKALQAASSLQIEDAEGLQASVDLLVRIKKVGNIITSKKLEITRPLNEALGKARDLFRSVEQSYQEAEGIVKQKMVAYNTKIARERAEVAEKLEARVEAGNMRQDTAITKLTAMQAPAATVQGDRGKATFRNVRVVKITDEAKIPREYLVPDMVAIRKAALEGAEIAGVEVVTEQQVAA